MQEHEANAKCRRNGEEEPGGTSCIVLPSRIGMLLYPINLLMARGTGYF
jgi:hypothetical protein